MASSTTLPEGRLTCSGTQCTRPSYLVHVQYVIHAVHIIIQCHAYMTYLVPTLDLTLV